MQGSDNNTFQKRYNNDAAFSKQINDRSKKFLQAQQIIFYSPPKQPTNKPIVSIKKTNDQLWDASIANRINIEMFFGIRQSKGKKSIEEILTNISMLIPRPTSAYSIVFFNTLAESSAYGDFKNALTYLPFQYLVHLQNIYVLHVSSIKKVFDMFNVQTLDSYINKKMVYFDSFSYLSAIIGINLSNVIKLIPKRIVANLSQSEEEVAYFQQIDQKKKQQPKMISSTKKIKKSIDEYEVGKTGAPLIIEVLINFFQKSQYLLTEGLFRKSANIQEETMLLKELERGNYDFLASVKDPHLPANGIKRFLTNLAEPLIPYNAYDRLMNADPTNYKTILTEIIGELNKNRRMTLQMLIIFFKQQLFSREYQNKMNEDNMSVVMGPCFMDSHTPSIYSVKRTVVLTQILFKKFDSIFGNESKSDCIAVQIESQKEIKETKQMSVDVSFFQDKQSTQLNSQITLAQEQLQNLENVDDFLKEFNKKI